MDQKSTVTALSRRRFLAKSALAVGAASASPYLGLGSAASTEAKEGRDTQTLTVMYYGNTDNSYELTTHAMRQFEGQHPGVKVRYLEYDPVALSASLASGQPPDFIRVIGAMEMPNIAARGLALNLDPYFAGSTVLRSSDLDPVNNVYRWDGKVQGQGPRYGMAKDYSQDLMLWYNKDLFDRAGVKYPSGTEPLSYDDLIRLGKKLTVRKNGKIVVYGYNAEWGAWTIGRLAQMMAQQGKPLFNHDLTEVDLTGPEARKILKWYVDYAQAHIGPSPLDPEANWDGALWPAQRVALVHWGYWFGAIANVPGPNGKPVSNAGLAAAPQIGPNRVNACVTAVGAWIPQASQNKELAWKFFEFFMGGAPAVERAKEGSGMPALKSLRKLLPQGTTYQKAAYDVVQANLPFFKILHFSPYVAASTVDAAFNKYMTPVAKGQVKLEDGARQFEQAVNQALRQGKRMIG